MHDDVPYLHLCFWQFILIAKADLSKLIVNRGFFDEPNQTRYFLSLKNLPFYVFFTKCLITSKLVDIILIKILRNTRLEELYHVDPSKVGSTQKFFSSGYILTSLILKEEVNSVPYMT